MKQLTQEEFMYNFNNKYREKFNPKLFERNNEDAIEGIYDVVKSCERDKYFTLKLLSFDVIYDYEEIFNVLRQHEENRKRKNSKVENLYDYINIRDTDMILIRMKILLRHNGVERQEIDGKTVEVVNPEEVMEQLVALPRFVRKYYYRLSGCYYTSTFQIVDGSTYNNATASQSRVDTNTMKTNFQPIRLFRTVKELVDVRTNEIVKVIDYNANVFSYSTNALYYLFANLGYYGVCDFLDIHHVSVSLEPCLFEDHVCFNKHNIYISCPKILFQDHMVQAFISCLYNAISKDTMPNTLFDIRFWLKLLGFSFKNASIDKGLFVLDSVDGIYDNITKKKLHLSEEDKNNIYSIFRWMLREFSQIRMKENTDVRTKRVRISEYISQLYATKLNRGMYSVTDMGRRVTLAKLIQRLYIQPMYIINNLTSAAMNNLIEYREMVNDLDSTIALKFTYKGISGLGEDGSSIQPIYRYIDPSYIGILDLDSSPTSDPGMSGMICPMTKLYDYSFSKYEEPNTWRQNWEKTKEKYYKTQDPKETPITFTTPPPPPSYNGLRERIVQEELDFNRIECPVENIYDPNIVYTCSGAVINKQINEENDNRKNLFTIINTDKS